MKTFFNFMVLHLNYKTKSGLVKLSLFSENLPIAQRQQQNFIAVSKVKKNEKYQGII
jgi:hypothetical protein